MMLEAEQERAGCIAVLRAVAARLRHPDGDTLLEANRIDAAIEGIEQGFHLDGPGKEAGSSAEGRG